MKPSNGRNLLYELNITVIFDSFPTTVFILSLIAYISVTGYNPIFPLLRLETADGVQTGKGPDPRRS